MRPRPWWLRQRPTVVNLLTPWLLVTGTAFTVGFFTRTTYGLFVAGMLVWAYVAESLESTHPLGTFMLAVVALLPSRWGDGLSIDAWIGSAGPRPAANTPGRGTRPTYGRHYAPGRHYGYCTWVPGLAFGVGNGGRGVGKDPPGARVGPERDESISSSRIRSLHRLTGGCSWRPTPGSPSSYPRAR